MHVDAYSPSQRRLVAGVAGFNLVFGVAGVMAGTYLAVLNVLAALAAAYTLRLDEGGSAA